MNKSLLIGFSFFALLVSFSEAQITKPEIWISRSISTDTVYYEEAPDSTIATVTLTAHASEDSVTIGYPIDVLFACDLSGSMGWEPLPHRITLVQSAARKFIDSLNQGYDRVAIMGWASSLTGITLADTGNTARYHKRWFPFSQNLADAKHFIARDLHLDGTLSSVVYLGDTLTWRDTIPGGTFGNTPFNISTIVGLQYLRTHAENPSVLILLTDGENNDGVSNASTLRFVDSIYKNYGIRTFAIGFNGGSFSYLTQLADTGGGAAYQANNAADLENVFHIISLQISDVIGVSITPGAPMLVDILGQDVHYVTGSYAPRTGGIYIAPSAFYTDVVGGLPRLNFVMDTLRAGKVMEVSYQITAALYTPDIDSARTKYSFITSSINPTDYSRIRYLDSDGNTVVKSFNESNRLKVKSRVDGIYLSYASDTVIVPSASKQIPLTYTNLAPAVFQDTTFYSILKVVATHSADYTNPIATWNFQPPIGWSAPVITNAGANSRALGITVAYDNAGTCSLKTQYTYAGRSYSDYLRFTASDASTPEVVNQILITRDTATNIPINARFTLTGNRTYLDSVRLKLFARGITSWNHTWPVNAVWSATAFTIYQSNLSSLLGTASRDTLHLDVPSANFSQSDSGDITISYSGMAYSFKLIIKDTTDYDTAQRVVIYDTAYGGLATQIENYYTLQTSINSISPTLGTPLTFYAMLFDTTNGSAKYVGQNSSTTWQLNSNAPVAGISFPLTNTTALQNDRLIVSFTNEWGTAIQDTVHVYWQFGTTRTLELETQPGIVGSIASNPAETLLIANTDDTVRGLYAVVRDEYGFCIASGEYENDVTWSLLSGSTWASTYVDIPTDSSAAGWVHRKSSPSQDTTFKFSACGLSNSVISGQRDTVVVRMTPYTYTRIDIFAAAPIQGYGTGDIIARTDTIRLNCDLSGSFQARALHDGNLYDVVSVSWSVQDPTVISSIPATGTAVTLDPIKRSTFNRLIATYISGSNTYKDTLRFMVEPPTLTALSLDSVKTANSGLTSITVQGNLSQIRARTFKLFSNGIFSCTGEPSIITANWSTTITDSWFASIVNLSSLCSLSIDLAAMPNIPGNHSMNGSVQIQNGSYTDVISFVVIDTTDYDTLERLFVDTSVTPATSLSFDTLRQNTRVYNMTVGDTLRLFPRLYDINIVQGFPVPKFIGEDTAHFAIRYASGATKDTNALSFAYTRTTANTYDTLILTYPASGRSLDEPLASGVNLLTMTVLVHWQAGSGVYMRLLSANAPTASPITDTTFVPDSLFVYAFLFDQFGNYFSNAAVETWSINDPTYLTIPSTATNICRIKKTGNPATTTNYQVIGVLPADTYLGNGRYSPSDAICDTFYVQLINRDVVIDSLRILTGHLLTPLNLTLGGTLSDSTVVSTGDTIVVQACDDIIPPFLAQIHIQDSGWIYKSVAWQYGGVSGDGSVAPNASSAPLDSLVATFQALTATIVIKTLPEYLTRIDLTTLPVDVNGRVIISGDTASLRTRTLTLSVTGETNCGTPVTDLLATWTVSGFQNPVWQNSFSTQIGGFEQNSVLLNFQAIERDTLPQSDSGWIAFAFPGTLNGAPHTFVDTVHLILQDITNYDTVDAVVIVTDSAYQATYDKSTLYNTSPNSTPFAGDTVKLRALLFDVNGNNNYKLLGDAGTGFRTLDVFWFHNGVYDASADSIYSLTNISGLSDTLIAKYGTSPSNIIYSDTVILNWSFGYDRFLYLEASPGHSGTTRIALDSIVLEQGQTKDTLYAVIRDEFGTFIQNPAIKWRMTPASYINYLTIPSSITPTNLGILTRIRTDTVAQAFNFIGSLSGTSLIDTIRIILANYSFDSLNLVADSTLLRNTQGATYAPNTSIGRNDTLFLTACEDTLKLKALLRRSDLNTWNSHPVTFALTNNACITATSFAEAAHVMVIPKYGVALDTLYALYTAPDGRLLTDTILFKVDRPWINQIIVVPGPTTLNAGDTFSFTIYGIDKNGDTVTLTDRLPDSLHITTDAFIGYLGNVFDTLIEAGTTLIVTNPFGSGVGTHSFVPVDADDNRIIIGLTIPGSNGSISTFRDTIHLTVNPGMPDSIAVFSGLGNTLIRLDTLSTYGDDPSLTSSQYRIQLYDAYGNLIPSTNPVYNTDLLISVSGGGLSNSNFIQNGVYLQYNAAGSETGGQGTVTIGYPRDSDTLYYHFDIIVVPLVKLLSISTHEWIVDTATFGQTAINLVLDSVLHINHASLTSNRARIDTLAHYGYCSYRDGYLDYLDIVFSEPFNLTMDVLINIVFYDTLSTQDSVQWALSRGTTTAFLTPTDNRPDSTFHNRYRLWLLPNSKKLTAAPILETGFLPRLTFSNDQIRQRNLLNPFPTLIGNSRSQYTTPYSLTVDSAPPVIADFLLQNNQCNPDHPNNIVQIVFSEPLKYDGFPTYSSIRGLTLLNTDHADSTFPKTMFISGEKSEPVNSDITQWNYDLNKMIVYEASIDLADNGYFQAGYSLLRFSVSPTNTQFKDLAGNRGCLNANRPVKLRNDLNAQSYICDLSGPTEVSRYTSIDFSWVSSKDGSSKGELIPGFPYFGFSISPDMLNNNGTQNTVIATGIIIDNRTYVLCDVDTTLAFVISDVTIFDILGNEVATPTSHKTLHSEYTVLDIRKLTGMDNTIENIDTMSAANLINYFKISESHSSAPDTLRPRYPSKINFGYDYMLKVCGPNSGESICMPSWNCLNSKGRLVAPGGYIISHQVRSGSKISVQNKKLIITSGKNELKF